jgi:hypothetical protein
MKTIPFASRQARVVNRVVNRYPNNRQVGNRRVHPHS